MHALKKYMASLSPVSEEGWEWLSSCMKEVSCKRNDYLLQQGQVCRSVFFISSGLCKACFLQDGKEINTAFYFENEFATNVKSLTTSTPSAYFLKACEKTTVVQLDKEPLMEAYRKSHEVEAFGRKVLELITAQQQDHADSFKLLTPRQRLDALTLRHPDFLQRISLTQAASYLGISRETLTRLRSAK